MSVVEVNEDNVFQCESGKREQRLVAMVPFCNIVEGAAARG